MARGRVHYPLKFRRARTVFYAMTAFWLWTWLGSAAFIASLFYSPLYAITAMYALFAGVLLSIPVAALAVIQMILNPPRRSDDDVVIRLGAQRQQAGRARPHERRVS